MVEVLFLVRHSKAVNSHPDGDRHRELSLEGRRRIEEMLPLAERQGFSAELALSSPYLRAVQTRDQFAPLVRASRTETSKAFTPEADAEEALGELKAWESAGLRRIAVFTHNPFVTDFAHFLLDPRVSAPDFHTPTIAAIAFDEGLGPRCGRLLWTLNP